MTTQASRIVTDAQVNAATQRLREGGRWEPGQPVYVNSAVSQDWRGTEEHPIPWYVSSGGIADWGNWDIAVQVFHTVREALESIAHEPGLAPEGTWWYFEEEETT